MRRSPLSLGDRLEAFGKLQPEDAATAAALAEMLRPREPEGPIKSAARRAALRTPTASTVNETLLGSKVPEAQAQPGGPLEEVAADMPLPPAGTTMITLLPRQPIAYAASTTAQPLGQSSSRETTREPPPLLAPNQSRAILATLSARPQEGLAIDVAALLRRIVRGAPLLSLPRREVWSARRGVQLLIDSSLALTPVNADVDAVERRLTSILGKERLERLYFSGCPSRGLGPGERSTWKPWKPPITGAPVIAITDLGCAGFASNDEWAGPEEWARFAEHARSSGAAVVALLPFPVHRVPQSLAKRITVIPWSESLSAARVRRILSDARGGHVPA